MRCSPSPPIYAVELASKKIANCACNFLRVGFQGEVTGFEEMHSGARVVAFERFGARRQEEPIVVPPDCQRWRLLAAKLFLEFGIERDITGIIQKQVQLNLIIAGPTQ